MLKKIIIASLVLGTLAVLFYPVYERITPATYILNDGKNTKVTILDGYLGKPMNIHQWRLLQSAQAADIVPGRTSNTLLDYDAGEEKGAFAVAGANMYKWCLWNDTVTIGIGRPVTYDYTDSRVNSHKVCFANSTAGFNDGFVGIAAETVTVTSASATPTKYFWVQVGGTIDAYCDTTTIGDFVVPIHATQHAVQTSQWLVNVVDENVECTYPFFARVLDTLNCGAATNAKVRVQIFGAR